MIDQLHIIEHKAPGKLVDIQKWFASIITRPIDVNNCMDYIAPSGIPMEDEARKFITPGVALTSAQRIEIYNQQYWWRLLEALQEIYPTLVRLFGYEDFNQSIAIPYLKRYPPDHWSINHLGRHLSNWLSENYHANDAPMVRGAASIDWVFQDSFFVESSTPLALQDSFRSDAQDYLSRPLKLQPFLHLFQMPFDLFSFREILLKEDVNYWFNHNFPKLAKEKAYYFLVFRNDQLSIEWIEISEGQWRLLSLLEKGTTLQDACKQLETEGGSAYDEAIEKIGIWMRNWVILGWLVPHDQ